MMDVKSKNVENSSQNAERAAAVSTGHDDGSVSTDVSKPQQASQSREQVNPPSKENENAVNHTAGAGNAPAASQQATAASGDDSKLLKRTLSTDSQQKPPLAPSTALAVDTVDSAGVHHQNSPDDLPSAATCHSSNEGTIRLPGVSTSMVVKEKKGRFNLLQEAPSNGATDTIVADDSPSTPQPHLIERAASNSSAALSNATPKTFDGTGAPTVKKKGRFVVTNVKDPAFVAVPVQAVVAPVHAGHHVRANSLNTLPPYGATVMLAGNSLPPQSVVYMQPPVDPSHEVSQPQLPPTTPQALPSPKQPPATVETPAPAPKKPETTARRAASVPSSTRANGGLQHQQGLGKVMYFLDQMRSEVSEADRSMKSMQTDMKCLRDKNKELETKLRDMEKKWHEEKALREGAEKRCRQLRKKLRQFEDSASTQKEETQEDDGLQGTKIGHSRSDSIDAATLPDIAQLSLSASDDVTAMDDKLKSTSNINKTTAQDGSKIGQKTLAGNAAAKSGAIQSTGVPPPQPATTPPQDQGVTMKPLPRIPQPGIGVNRSMSADSPHGTPQPSRTVGNISIDGGIDSTHARSLHVPSPDQVSKPKLSSVQQIQPQPQQNLRSGQPLPNKPVPQDFDPLRRPPPESQHKGIQPSQAIHLPGQNVAFPIVGMSQGTAQGGPSQSSQAGTPPQTPATNGQGPQGNPYVQHGDLQSLQQPMLLLPQHQFAQMQEWPQHQMIFPTASIQHHAQQHVQDSQPFATQNPFDSRGSDIQAVLRNSKGQSSHGNLQAVSQNGQHHHRAQVPLQSQQHQHLSSSQSQLQWMQQPGQQQGAKKIAKDSQATVKPDPFENLIT